MKRVTIIALAGFGLAACGGPGEDPAEQASADLRSDCAILATDPEAQESFADMGTDGDGFCDCFVIYVAAQPEEVQRTMTLTLDRVADAMEESGNGAEEVVGGMMDGSQQMEDTAAAADLQAGIAQIGRSIDDIENGFEDSGACPVTVDPA